MTRRERRYNERQQKKLILKTREDIIKMLEKKFPTDEDKIAYIKQLQQELLDMEVKQDTFDSFVEEI